MHVFVTKFFLLPVVADKMLRYRYAAYQMISTLYEVPFQYRLETGITTGQPVLWVQAKEKPGEALYFGPSQTKRFDYTPLKRDTYRFRLVLVLTLPNNSSGPKNFANIKNSGLFQEWLHTTGWQNGFKPLPGFHATADLRVRIKLAGSQASTPRRLVRFDGTLSVLRPSRFLRAISDGVGEYQEYGSGLLSCIKEEYLYHQGLD